MVRLIAVLLILLNGFTPAHADAEPRSRELPIITFSAQSPDELFLNANALYAIDSAQNVTIQNIRFFLASHGTATQSQVNFGVSPHTLWFAFQLKNIDSVPLARLFVAEDYFLEVIDTYVFSGDTIRNTLHGGCAIPFGKREMLNRYTAHRIGFRGGETLTFFVRVKCRLTMNVPLKLWNEDTFVYDDFLTQIPMWLYYGVVLGLFAYNFLFG